MPQINPFQPAVSPTGVSKPLNLDSTGNLKTVGAVTPALNPSAGAASLKVDSSGALLTGGALSSTLNITTATVVKAAAGKLVKYSVVVGGSTAGSINDCLTTGAAASTNQFVAIPTTVTVAPSSCDWPCSVGIVVVPGTGSTVAVTFD
jgi:hypothetical protein